MILILIICKLLVKIVYLNVPAVIICIFYNYAAIIISVAIVYIVRGAISAIVYKLTSSCFVLLKTILSNNYRSWKSYLQEPAGIYNIYLNSGIPVYARIMFIYSICSPLYSRPNTYWYSCILLNKIRKISYNNFSI